MRKHGSKKSLKQWSWIILLVCILPLNLISLYAAAQASESYRQQTALSIQNVMNVEMNRLNTILTKADNYLFTLIQSENGRVVRWPESQLDFQNARIKMMMDMNDNLPSDQYGSGYFILTDHDFGENNNAMENMLISGAASDTATIRSILEDEEQLASVGKRWMLLTIQNRSYLIHKNEINGIIYGAFVDYQAWETNFLSQLSYENTLLLTDLESTNTKGNRIVITGNALKLSWPIYCVVNMGSVNAWNVWQFVAVLCCFLCAPVIYLLFSKYILRTFSELTHAHCEFKNGNRDYRIVQPAPFREMETAFFSYNEMAENLHDLRLENMEKELKNQNLMLEKQELEITNLQLQIHPHFLLNTFNLVYNLAAQGNVESIQKTILYLSDYFRYLFRNGRTQPRFEKELKLIEEYIEIAQTRYPGRIDTVFEIDEDMLLVHVPPLLFHNFVENCIKHGLKDDNKICIVITAEYTNGWVKVEISDDGRGMPEDVVKAINTNTLEQEEKGKNVGIRNSVKRLYAIYGEQATLHVDSAPDEGTTVSIRFPYELETD